MLFYQQGTVTLCNEKVQKQLGGSDCGLMALAFANDLSHGLDPATQRYSQFEMRKHFVSCLESKKMKPFPKTKRRVHCYLFCNRNFVPIFCLCRLPKQEYIQCCSCRGWYHPRCCSVQHDGPSHQSCHGSAQNVNQTRQKQEREPFWGQ
ncbi:unnamed protein product [Porites evermanni]|uniref:Ubiquitin-like protease family profile domain-containing protein n=1 Tax=Porites evermanni TaxID=104178 RepID=A0ABN8PKI2_9CNID|nr:unnamed protein product [Porites evermanni]